MASRLKQPPGEKTEERIDWVVTQIERTVRDSVIVRETARKYGITDRTAREYLRAAYEKIRELRKEGAEFDFDRVLALKFQVAENALADRLRALEEMDSPAVEPGDRAKFLAVAVRAGSVVNAASDQITKMHGLYAPEKVEHSGAIGRPESMTPAQREKRIQELLAKRDAERGSAERE
jgi:predicted transcriptional regulator